MDWRNIIAEIQRHGQLTQAQIAKTVDCGQATISDLANGSTKQPNYSLGASLLRVLEQVKTARPPEIQAQAATETVAGGVENV